MRYCLIALVCLLTIGTVVAQDGTNSRGYEIALERIQYAKENNETVLFLNALLLEEIPPEIGELTQLERLYANFNHLETLPPEIGNLTNLRILNLSNNELETLPPEFGNLTNLYRLWLHDNQLVDLPTSIASFEELCYLYLRNNPMPLSDVPSEIYQHQATHRAECALELRTVVADDVSQYVETYAPAQSVTEAESVAEAVEIAQTQAVWYIQWIVIGMSLAIIGAIFWILLAYRDPRKSKAKRH